MFMKRELWGYIPLIPNIDKPFPELSEEEAMEHLKWFVSHIDERADYIKRIIAAGLGVQESYLDYSLESLKIVWKWFLRVAETTKPKWKNRIRFGKKKAYDEDERDFSVRTLYIIRDIGMYVAKVFLHNYPKLEWTVKTKPKNYISVNEPLLIGFVDDNPMYPKPFYPDLEPIAFVHGCAINIFYGMQHEEDLYNQCLRMVKWIPKA